MSLISPLRCPAVWALACLPLFASQALAAANSVNFGNVTVGATVSATVSVTFSQPGQIAAVKVLLLGAPGLDFRQTGGTCQRGSAYQAGQSCTVQTSFKPQAPGTRNGAVVLANAANATIATAYLTGNGQGPLPTFPAGTAILAVPDVGPNGWTLDGAGNIYYMPTSSPGVILRVTAAGTYAYATLPSQYASAALKTIDGAGNLILTYQNQLLKVDPSGATSLLITIPPPNPYQPTASLGGVAALGNGDIKVGSGPQPKAGPDPGAYAPYYTVQPGGTLDTSGGGAISNPLYSVFIDAVAVGPANETYLGAGNVYTSGSNFICQVPNESGLAVDASSTLLTGTPTDQNAYIGPNPPIGCVPTVPVINQLPFVEPVVDAHGDIYVESTLNATHPVYKYIRTQLHGVVFASAGTATSYGSMAITNSGNQPLNLSALQPALSGPQPTSFTIEGTSCGQSLAPAATCTISLSYTPSGMYSTLPASASLLLTGLPNQQEVVPLNGFPNQ